MGLSTLLCVRVCEEQGRALYCGVGITTDHVKTLMAKRLSRFGGVGSTTDHVKILMVQVGKEQGWEGAWRAKGCRRPFVQSTFRLQCLEAVRFFLY